MPDYNVDYYIQKFEAIPEEKWGTLAFERDGKCCALGHCGWRFGDDFTNHTNEEGRVLADLFIAHRLTVTTINDAGWNEDGARQFPQPTPRARILAALAWIKEQEAGK